MIDRVAFLVQSGLNGPRKPDKSIGSASIWLTLTPHVQPSTSTSILACSAVDLSREHRELFGMRALGEDRKSFFDHLKPSNFIKGVSCVCLGQIMCEEEGGLHSLGILVSFFLGQVVRVTMTQGSTIYSTYLSDQLREDMKRDDLVNEGRLSRSEAEQQAEEWEQVSVVVVLWWCLKSFCIFYLR